MALHDRWNEGSKILCSLKVLGSPADYRRRGAADRPLAERTKIVERLRRLENCPVKRVGTPVLSDPTQGLDRVLKGRPLESPLDGCRIEASSREVLP